MWNIHKGTLTELAVTKITEYYIRHVCGVLSQVPNMNKAAEMPRASLNLDNHAGERRVTGIWNDVVSS